MNGPEVLGGEEEEDGMRVREGDRGAEGGKMCVRADVHAMCSFTINPRYGANDSSSDVPQRTKWQCSVLP